MSDFTDKVVVITGAGSNVGRAVADRLRAEGARLALADIRTDGLGEAGDLVVGADLTRASDAERLAAETVARFGRVDVLACTVGIDPPGARTVTDTSEADWDRIMSVNVKSVFLACRALIPHMQAGGGGSIVTVASQGALLTMPGMAAYGVSKAAVLQLTRQIAVDYGRDNIRANAVCPSGLEMPSLDRLELLEEDQLARRREAMGRLNPLGQVCSPAHVADAMMYLAGSGAAFVTGVAMPVEGGGTMALRF
jgi:NAD(P)-dependent dehydrogenase (short-subunit alcohol dehydrogenase family)